MRGISANIMCGQHGNYGTSSFQLFFDLNRLMKPPFRNENPSLGTAGDKNNTMKEKETIEEMFQSKMEVEEVTDDYSCSMKELTIQNNIISMKRKFTGGIEDYEDYDMGF